MEGWMWLVLASMFGVGGLLGYVLGRAKGDNLKEVRDLEAKVAESEKALEEYKAQVAQHFGKTAELFNQLTTDYRAVYEHLAASSEALCGDQVAKISAEMPDKKLLEKEEKPVVEARAEEKPEPKPAETEKPQEKNEEKATAKDEGERTEEAARTIH